MRRDLAFVPHGRKALDQIARRHDVDAKLADALDGTGVDPGDVRDRAAGRVLHRHPALSGEQPAEFRVELQATGVAGGRPREVGEGARFDAMDEPAGLAVGRDEVVPAARGQVAALARHARDVGGNRVQAAEIVEQPAVEPLGPERRLDGGERKAPCCGLRRHDCGLVAGHQFSSIAPNRAGIIGEGRRA